MNRPKIKTTLLGVLLLIGLITGGFAAYSVNRLQATNTFVTDLASRWLLSITMAKDIQIELADLRMTYRDHILATDETATTAVEAKIATTANAVNALISRYETTYASTAAEHRIIGEMKGDLEKYGDLGKQLTTLSHAGRDEDAKVMLATTMAPLGGQIRDGVAELVAFNTSNAQASVDASAAVYSATLSMTFLAIGVCALIILASIVFALKGIARPIQSITSSMTRLAAGDTQSAIPYSGRADEIGEMAAAVEIFRKAAVSNKQLEQDAEAARRQSETDRIRVTAEAEAAAQARLQEATAGLAVGLRRLASGDLSFQLNDAFAPDFETLREDLNGAVSQLAGTLRSVAQATSQIDNGTREISQSTDDLSRRTEQQAASLEETAAALDEITANVSNSSKRADEARSVAVQANASAVQSGKVVSDAVDAMQKIEQSSTQVSNIIGVIDEIAFQTNLLALNAGVEAARAGEAGKGFAVVAQEVRELAQRSAQAAKEIKELIRNSSVEVQSGVKLVSETGDALKTIEGYVVTINHHMDAIATSAREQSVGLAEVNTAVNQMDQVTQQNAAMVEESNAASAALVSEAERLRGLVGQFKLGNAQYQTAATTGADTRQRPAETNAQRPRPRVARGFSGNAAIKEAWEDF